MSNPVAQHFTQKFLNLYGAPDAVDPKAYVEEYARALTGTDPEILRLASNRIVDGRIIDGKAVRGWPSVGECVAAVKSVALRLEADRRSKAYAEQAAGKSDTVPMPDAKERVKALVKQAKSHLANADLERRLQNPPPALTDWKRGQKPAWEARMVSDPHAKHLSLPEYTRAELEGRTPRKP